MLRQTHNVVARELPLLLKNLVLVDQKVSAKGFVFVLFNKLLHLVVAEAQKLGIGNAAQIDVHMVLHKEGAMVDGRALVKLFNHKFIVFKLRVGLDDAVLYEVERVGTSVLSEHD